MAKARLSEAKRGEASYHLVCCLEKVDKSCPLRPWNTVQLPLKCGSGPWKGLDLAFRIAGTTSSGCCDPLEQDSLMVFELLEMVWNTFWNVFQVKGSLLAARSSLGSFTSFVHQIAPDHPLTPRRSVPQGLPMWKLGNCCQRGLIAVIRFSKCPWPPTKWRTVLKGFLMILLFVLLKRDFSLWWTSIAFLRWSWFCDQQPLRCLIDVTAKDSWSLVL